MKPVLSLAYVVDSTSLGTISIENAIALGNVTTAQTLSSPTVSQQLIAALGKIQLAGASFSTLNMGAPLIKSLNLDLLFRGHKHLFDEVNLLSATSFDINKSLEDVSELSDIAGKVINKSGIFDLIGSLNDEHYSNQTFKTLEDLLFLRVDLLSSKVEKGLVDILTFEEDVYFKWDSALIQEHLGVVNASRLETSWNEYTPTLDKLNYLVIGAKTFFEKAADTSSVGLFVESEQWKPILAEDKLSTEGLDNRDIFKDILYDFRGESTSEESAGLDANRVEDGTNTNVADKWNYLNRGAKFSTFLGKTDIVELEEVPLAFRPFNPEDQTDFEDISSQNLKLNFVNNLKPYQDSNNNYRYNSLNWPGQSSYSSAISGPLTERDIELAIIDSSRRERSWNQNAFYTGRKMDYLSTGAKFSVANRLQDTVGVTFLPYFTKVRDEFDETDFEHVVSKNIELKFAVNKTPYLYSHHGAPGGSGYFMLLAANGRSTGQGIGAAASGISATYTSEYHPSRGLFTDRDIELATIKSARWGNNEFPGTGISFSKWKRLTDILTVKQLIEPVKIVYAEDVIEPEELLQQKTELSFTQNKFLYYSGGEPYRWYQSSSGSSMYATYINNENASNSAITERDTELVHVFAGRDQMAFQLPLPMPQQLASIKTDYVLAGKALIEHDEMGFAADTTALFYRLKALTEGIDPSTGYWVAGYTDMAHNYVPAYYVPAVYGTFEQITDVDGGDESATINGAVVFQRRDKRLNGTHMGFGFEVEKAPFFDPIKTTVQALATKVVDPLPEIFTALATLEDKLIYKGLDVTQVRTVVPAHYVYNAQGVSVYVPEEIVPSQGFFRAGVDGGDESVTINGTTVSQRKDKRLTDAHMGFGFDIDKPFDETLNILSKPELYRPEFAFDKFEVSSADVREIQKRIERDYDLSNGSIYEDLLVVPDTFDRQVTYKRDYQAENALADDNFSAISQNYSNDGYFSQAYVGTTITGD